MKKPRIVLKLSGNLFNFNSNYDTLKEYILSIERISEEYQPIIVAGGGKIARFYIDLARSFELDESGLDIMGIQVSHLNAKLLISGLGEKSYPLTPSTLEEISSVVLTNKIIVTGGLYPGQSTNATSALIAERVRARRFLNATDVDGIYDFDPRSNPKARKFETIKVKECIDLLKAENSMAGTYDLMDLISLKVIERSKLATTVFKSSPSNIEKVIMSNEKIGTEISI